MSFGKLWEIVNKIRLEFLIENVNVAKSWSCFSADDENDALVSGSHMGYLIYSFRKEVIEISGPQHQSTGSLTFEKVQKAGEMFIFLTLCPKFMFDWIQLYFYLLQNASPEIMVQTLNRIKVSGKLKGDIASKIFTRIDNELSLKYKTIDKLIKIEKNFSLEPSYASKYENFDEFFSHSGKCYIELRTFVLDYMNFFQILYKESVTIQFTCLMKRRNCLHHHSYLSVPMGRV